MKKIKKTETLTKENVFLKKEVVRLSALIIQRVKEGRKIRGRLESALLENKKRRQELAKKVQERTKELQKKIQELEKFQKLAVGRELKMIELKNKLKGRINN